MNIGVVVGALAGPVVGPTLYDVVMTCADTLDGAGALLGADCT